jgi:membrane protein YqaA with SNARE-associated domain
VTDALVYLGLFAAAFGAASLLPMQSEPVLVALLLAEAQPASLLLLVASIGNTLGSVLNWAIGGQVHRFRERRWFPASAAALRRAEAWYHRWGRWSLLLSWAPFIGDPLTVVAGVLREPLWSFVLIVGFAKTARYVALAALTLGWA